MKPSFEQLKQVTQGYEPLCVSFVNNNPTNNRQLQVYYRNSAINAVVWKYVYLADDGKFYARIKTFQAQGNYDATSQYCLTEDDLIVKPELQVYWVLASIAILTLVFVVIYKIIIKRLLP